MTPQEFLVEEYKQLQKEMESHRNLYARLEVLTFSGAVAAYGFLLSHPEIPAVAWAVIPVFVSIAAVRCLAHYWIINHDLARKIGEIERTIYGGTAIRGYQESFDKRHLNLFFNTSVWTTVLLASLLALFWRASQPLDARSFMNLPWWSERQQLAPAKSELLETLKSNIASLARKVE